MAAMPENAAPAERTAAPPPDTKTRLTHKLPTYRAGFAKHMDCLRAYAVLSEGGTKAVHYVKIADIIKLHEANVSSMNPFFQECGFIEKQAGGYVPHAAVVEYNRAHQWNPENAAEKLGGLVLASWFGQALSQRLQFRPMTEDEAIEMLAAECNAGPEMKGQLRMLIEFAEASGVVRREGGQLFALRGTPVAQTEPVVLSTIASPRVTPESFPAPAAAASQAASPAGGAINFQVSVNVDLAQMKGWSADRIAAFFAGIAQVLAAQEKGG